MLEYYDHRDPLFQFKKWFFNAGERRHNIMRAALKNGREEQIKAGLGHQSKYKKKIELIIIFLREQLL